MLEILYLTIPRNPYYHYLFFVEKYMLLSLRFLNYFFIVAYEPICVSDLQAATHTAYNCTRTAKLRKTARF